MKCNNCGHEYNDMFEVCPNCGVQPDVVEPVSLSPAHDTVLSALKDKGFLAICILMTVASGMSLMGGSISVLNILFTVFLWLTYSAAEKGFADSNHLKCISGTVYASYVITNVTSIIFIVCGILSAVLFSLEMAEEALHNGLSIVVGEQEINEYIAELEGVVPNALTWFGMVFSITFVVIGVLVLVFNIIAMKKIHLFAKSVYQGIELQNSTFENPKAVKNWLMVFGVCGAISTLSGGNIVAFIANGCAAATTIIASTLVNKYFVQKNYI